jgi:hypothetical protein
MTSHRLSMLDLIANGSSWEEIVDLAVRIEDAGATIINTGPPPSSSSSSMILAWN